MVIAGLDRQTGAGCRGRQPLRGKNYKLQITQIKNAKRKPFSIGIISNYFSAAYHHVR